MKSRWLSLALVAWGVLVQAAAAQPPYGQASYGPSPYGPSPYGAGRVPEPIPISPSQVPGQPAAPMPNLVPGPITPEILPQGPPSALSLPANAPGAFMTEPFQHEEAYYLHLGFQSLQRERFGSLALAVFNPQPADNGIAPPVGAPLAFDIGEISEIYKYGPRATLGWLVNGSCLEVTGFFIPEDTRGSTITSVRNLDGMFINPPVGFEGNRSLWLQADTMLAESTSQFGSAELNFRVTNVGLLDNDLIFGFRYLDLYETVTIYTDDGIPSPATSPQPAALRQAFYHTGTRNRILGPQLGWEYTLVTLPWLSYNFNAKGMWGVNFLQSNVNLVRGDGFVGFDNTDNTLSWSQAYEISMSFDIHILERCRLRFGYTALWMLNIANAQDQIQLNLSNSQGNQNYNGSVYFHGPMAEFQFLF